MKKKEMLENLELSGGIVITGNSRRVTNFLAALDEATEILKRIDTDGCVGCKYEDVPPHRPPCNECKRNCHDFWESEEN